MEQVKDVTIDIGYDAESDAVVFTHTKVIEDVHPALHIDGLIKQVQDQIRHQKESVKELKERVLLLKEIQVKVRRRQATKAIVTPKEESDKL